MHFCLCLFLKIGFFFYKIKYRKRPNSPRRVNVHKENRHWHAKSILSPLLNINDLIWQVDCASVNIHWHYPSKSGKFDLALIELVITNPNTFSNNACPLLSVKKITRRHSLEQF